MSSDDGWSLFEARTRPRRLNPDEASLTKTNIVISEELFQKFKAHSVVLEFRAEPRTIRIRPAKKERGGVQGELPVDQRPVFLRPLRDP